MLTCEQAKNLLNSENINFEDILYLDCLYNTLHLPYQALTMAVSEPQKRLLICLLKSINCKQEIIKVVWNDNHQRIRDNNYHQLIFQFRSLLQRNGLPANLVITVPYYGIKLNEPLLKKMRDDDEPSSPQIKDHKTSSALNKKNWIPQLLTMARSLF